MVRAADAETVQSLFSQCVSGLPMKSPLLLDMRVNLVFRSFVATLFEQRLGCARETDSRY